MLSEYPTLWIERKQDARKTINPAVEVVGVTTLGHSQLLTIVVALSFKHSTIMQHDIVMEGSGAARKTYKSFREGSRRHELGLSTASDHGRHPLIQRFDDPAI